jgi:hypothetical protein
MNGVSGIPVDPRQLAAFIELLRKTCNVTQSAKSCGFDRVTAYRYRERDPDFAAAWNDAIESAVDDLEGEARRRAYEGTEEYVVSSGRVVTLNETPLTVRRYSDQLMISLLAAHRPEKYRARSSVELTGKNGGPIVGATIPTDDPVEAARIYQQLMGE